MRDGMGMGNRDTEKEDPKEKGSRGNQDGDNKTGLADAEQAAGAVPVPDGDINGCRGQDEREETREETQHGQRKSDAVIPRPGAFQRGQFPLFLAGGKAVGAKMAVSQFNRA